MALNLHPKLAVAGNCRSSALRALISAGKGRLFMPNIYSGVCLTAMFSAIAQEHRRLKGEAYKIKATLESLARSARPEVGRPEAASGHAAGRS